MSSEATILMCTVIAHTVHSHPWILHKCNHEKVCKPGYNYNIVIGRHNILVLFASWLYESQTSLRRFNFQH